MRKRFGVASGESGALGGDSESDEGWGDKWYPNGNMLCMVEFMRCDQSRRLIACLSLSIGWVESHGALEAWSHLQGS